MKNISIDGPSGAGKSTIAKKLANLINFNYLDTGTMYRAITYYLIQNNINLDAESDIKKELENIEIKFKNNVIYVNNKALDFELRTNEVTKNVSLVASYKSVRDKLVSIQREIACKSNVILDGRDIGTVVLPNADFKFFLTASPEARAMRRYEEFKDFKSDTYEEVLEDIKRRDYYDSHREISPLVKADDAILIDSTELNLEETTNLILSYIRGEKDAL